MSDPSLQRFIPNASQKAEALGSVFYEIQQLWGSTCLASSFSLAMNAFLESMLVHVRVLLDFFEREERSAFGRPPTRAENDDVLCSDYGFTPRPVGLDPQYRARLNKDLVHLAYSRSERRLPDDKKWPRSAVVRPLVERTIEFIEFLDESTLSQTRGVTVADWQRLRDDLIKMRAGFAGLITDI